MDIYTDKETQQLLGKAMPGSPNYSNSICSNTIAAPIAGSPWIFTCTRPPGHKGLHVAHDSEELAVAIWLNKADPEGIL